jgi:UPF0271 protein
MSKGLIVLDASALIAGYEPENSKGKHYTVPEVVQELRDETTLIRVQAAVDSGRLIVETPRAEVKEQVMKIARETGEGSELSSADLSVLSIALQLTESTIQVTVISDDYSVQNLAVRLNLKYAALSTRGISQKIIWRTYCPGCFRSYKKAVPDNICPVCGTELKRKPVRKTKIENHAGNKSLDGATPKY